MKKSIVATIIFLLAGTSYCSEILDIPLSDGVVIQGKLETPSANTTEIPVLVVFLPGTGPNTYLNKRKFGETEFNYYDLFSEEFTCRGIAFFSYNRRGVEIGDKPPYFDRIDSLKYAKYTPLREAQDVESIISELRKVKGLRKSKIILLGASEGTIIASLVAERKIVNIDALFFIGYAHDNLYDIIKWQLSGASSIINLRKYFDIDHNNTFSREEYESTDSIATIARNKLLNGAGFEALNLVQDSVIDYRDFALRTVPFFDYLMKMTEEGNDAWIWNNYFRISSRWLKDHFELEANKTRLLQVDIPIYIFHGTNDANARVEGVFELKESFEKMGKTNLHVQVFEGHDHDLNYIAWPYKNQISEGLLSIFNSAEVFLGK